MSVLRRAVKAFLTDTWCNHDLEIIEERYPVFP